MPPSLSAFIYARSKLVHGETEAAEYLTGLQVAVDAAMMFVWLLVTMLSRPWVPISVTMSGCYRCFSEADTIYHKTRDVAFDAHILRFRALDRLVALWRGITKSPMRSIFLV